MRFVFAKDVGDGRTMKLSEYRKLRLADIEKVRAEAHIEIDQAFDQRRDQFLAELAHVHDPLPDDPIH